jgi:ribosomal-protein-alanine acetyltransferase
MAPRPALVRKGGAAFTVTAAAISDLDAIDAIERASFDGDRFSRRNLRRLLASKSIGAYVAKREGRALGYLLLLYRKGAKAARLYSVATHPDARGEGVAAALIDVAARDAMRRGCDRLRLEVRPSNVAARRVYERFGFAEAGERPAYYSDGATALLMDMRLSPGEDRRS